MRRFNLERFGIILVVVIGFIHLVQAPVEYAEAPYLGILFGVNVLAALAAGGGIYRRMAWGWLLGMAIAAGSISGYILSRTVGMPGMAVAAWLLPLGIVSLLVEALFVGVALVAWPQVAGQRRWFFARSQSDATQSRARVRYLAPSAILASMLALTAVTGYLQVRVVDVTQDMMVDEYGMQIAQVSTTMLGGIVDVRVRIVDPEKAAPYFDDHNRMPLLVVDGSNTVIYPVQHSHAARLVPGRTFAMLYPNPAGVVKADSKVSLVFGKQKSPLVTVE